MLKTLGEKVKILRNSKGYTLLTVSEKLNMTIFNYTGIENNTKPLSLAQILKICSLYFISVHKFISLGEPVEEITNDNLEDLTAQLNQQAEYISRLQTRIIYLEEKLRNTPNNHSVKLAGE